MVRVAADQGLVEVLKKMRLERTDVAVVVSTDGPDLGVVQAHDVERRIADSVILAGGP